MGCLMCDFLISDLVLNLSKERLTKFQKLRKSDNVLTDQILSIHLPRTQKQTVWGG
jgi:hypothetical protein